MPITESMKSAPSQQPLVSIVTPSYNQGLYIEQAIRSVLRQTYPSVEHIIIDGKSTDETQDILRKYNGLVVWLSEDDGGETEATNKGFRMVQGSIIGWLSTDDLYEPDAVEYAVRYFEENPNVAMVYGDCKLINRDGELIRVARFPEFDLRTLILRGGNYIFPPSMFFQRFVLNKVGLLDEGVRYANDYEFFIRIGSAFPVRHVSKVLGSYRHYAGALSSRNFGRRVLIRESLNVRRRYLTNPSLRDDLSVWYFDLRRYGYWAWEFLKMILGRSYRLGKP